VPFIVNTTVISNFAEVNRLDMLQLAFDELAITTQVYEEIQAGLSQGYDFYQNIDSHILPFSADGWLQLMTLQGTEELQLYGSLLKQLHSGEASSLTIAHYHNLTFLTDDKKARKIATTLNVPVSGTLGTLLLLVQDDHLSITKADQLLARMVDNGYFAPVTSLRSLIAKLDDS